MFRPALFLVTVWVVIAAPRPGVAAPGDDVDGDDIDGLGVLAIARAEDALVDATYAYANGVDAAAIAAGARLKLGAIGFIEGTLPVGDERPQGTIALGNVTLAGGLLPARGRLAGLALRVSAPTSPRVGTGMATAKALADPRLADPELWLPHTTSIELVGDWRWRGDATWVQLEAGFAGRWSPADYETVLRLGLAGGVRVDSWLDLTASFITRSYVLVRNQNEEFVHSLMLGIVAHHRRGELALRLEVPIDDSARNADRFLVGLELRGR